MSNIGFCLEQIGTNPIPSSPSNPIYRFNTSNVTHDGWTKFTYTVTSAMLTTMSGAPDHIMIGSFADQSGAPTNSLVVPSGGNSTVTCSGYDHNPSTTDVYYYIDDVSVLEIQIVNATATNTTGCTGESFTLTASGATSYTWQPGNLTGSSIVVTPTAATIYTVTGGGACTYSPATIGIYPAACCTNTNSGNITLKNVTIVPRGGSITWASLAPGNTYTGSINAPSSGIITNTLTVLGSLNINAPLTFSVCNILINEDVAINQNATTTIKHSYLYGGCNRLWHGVKSSAQLTVLNSWISDAYSAIDLALSFNLSSHPGLFVDNVMFNKNYHSIAAGTTTMNPNNFSITGCIFSCRNFSPVNYTTTTRYTALFPNIGGSVPQKINGSTMYGITYNTIRSHIGIYMAGIKTNTTTQVFTIGNTSATPSINTTYTNKYDYINQGVYNVYTKISLVNNAFSNIINTGVGNTLGAVYHNTFGNLPKNATETNVGGNSASQYKNTFYNVLDGVTAVNGGVLNVSYNEFGVVSRYGVNVQTWKSATAGSLTPDPVTVSYNTFTTTSYAFYANNNQTITASVTNNTLTQPAVTYTSTGYGAYLNEVSKPATAVYNVNNNTFSGGQYSIYLNNIKNARIVNNTITIKKPTSTGTFNSGVWLANSDINLIKGNAIDCNPTNSASWNTFGVFANASYSNTVKCNTISKVSACMKFQSNCNPTTISFNSLNNTGGTDPCLYGVWLDNSGQTGPIGYFNGAQWQMSDDVWGDFSSADTYAQNSSVGSNIYYDPSKTPSSLYQPLVNGNNGVGGALSYTPVSNSNNNSIGCGETSRIVGSGNVKGSGNYNDESDYNFSPKKRLFISETNSSNQKVIKGAHEAEFYTVDSLLLQYSQTNIYTFLTAARSVNNGINPNTIQEQNMKAFNSIYCDFLENPANVTSGQITNVQNMAWLCPFTDGLAVYEARGLMRNWDDSTLYYNTCENNMPENFSYRNAPGISSLENAILTSVHPNPTNGNLLVTCNCTECIFEVFDIAGKKVLVQKLNENETKVDISALNNGTYLYKISNNGTIVKTDKLILNK